MNIKFGFWKLTFLLVMAAGFYASVVRFSEGLGRTTNRLRVLGQCGENQSRAAEKLGIDRVTLHHKLKKYGWTRAAAETR
jgi:transcriptional regulator with AAA-type ATPase domain